MNEKILAKLVNYLIVNDLCRCSYIVEGYYGFVYLTIKYYEGNETLRFKYDHVSDSVITTKEEARTNFNK